MDLSPSYFEWTDWVAAVGRRVWLEEGVTGAVREGRISWGPLPLPPPSLLPGPGLAAALGKSLPQDVLPQVPEQSSGLPWTETSETTDSNKRPPSGLFSSGISIRVTPNLRRSTQQGLRTEWPVHCLEV